MYFDNTRPFILIISVVLFTLFGQIALKILCLAIIYLTNTISYVYTGYEFLPIQIVNDGNLFVVI
jgi:hypothetical protein